MKIIVEENAGCAEEIKIEYTPTEALIINHAMRRYACDEDVSANNRGIMERMLETEPIFMDRAEENDDAISRKAVIDEMCKRYSAGDMITLGFIQKLPSVKPQLDVLDKIKAEIENFEINGHVRDVECFNAGIKHVLTVIDKYRKESEET